jgi:hypothetical protein
MDNPKTQTTLSTRHRTKTNISKHTTLKIKKMDNTHLTKNPVVNPIDREG